MKLRPLGDRLVVQPIEAETTTSSGIIIANSKKSTPDRGTVIAVGPGKQLDDGTVKPTEFAVGDVVLFISGAGRETKVGNATYAVVDGDNVIGVIEE